LNQNKKTQISLMNLNSRFERKDQTIKDD